MLFETRAGLPLTRGINESMQLSAEISSGRAENNKIEQGSQSHEPTGLSRIYDEVDASRKVERVANTSDNSSQTRTFQSNPFLDIAGMKLLRPGYTANDANTPRPEQSVPQPSDQKSKPAPEQIAPPLVIDQKPKPTPEQIAPPPLVIDQKTKPAPEQIAPPPLVIDQKTKPTPEQKAPPPVIDQKPKPAPEQTVPPLVIDQRPKPVPSVIDQKPQPQPRPEQTTPPRPEPMQPVRPKIQPIDQKGPLPGHMPLPPFVIPGEKNQPRRDGLPISPGSGDRTIVKPPNVADHQMPLKHAPTISPQKINQVLAEYGSPARGMGQKIFDLGVEHGINPAMALAFYIQESSAGTRGAAVRTNSWGNIRQGRNGYRSYNTIEQGLVDWYQRINQHYIGKGFTTLGNPGQRNGVIHKYAPSSDGNNEGGYVRTVANLIRKWS